MRLGDARLKTRGPGGFFYRGAGGAMAEQCVRNVASAILARRYVVEKCV
jgi:hypothetical protein